MLLAHQFQGVTAPLTHAAHVGDTHGEEQQRFDAPRRRLKALVSTHVSLTGSEWGRKVLDSWEMMLPHWVYVIPKNLAASNEISQQDVPLRLVKA